MSSNKEIDRETWNSIKNLDYQDFYASNKLINIFIAFPFQKCSNLIRVLVEFIKPVVVEDFVFEFRKIAS